MQQRERGHDNDFELKKYYHKKNILKLFPTIKKISITSRKLYSQIFIHIQHLLWRKYIKCCVVEQNSHNVSIRKVLNVN